MQINLTNVLDPENPSTVTVSVPDGYALAQCPSKGRGSLARWLTALPEGSTMSAWMALYPAWKAGYPRRDMDLIKRNGAWQELVPRA